MKKNIVIFLIGLLMQQVTHAQGTVYLSNLGQASTSSQAVGNNSWYAAGFQTGSNAGGYVLNSVQLAMADAFGNPTGFTVMIYTDAGTIGALPGSSLGTLNGSLNPATSGIYSYIPASNLTLSPDTDYYIVLTAGTAIANGAYKWSLAGANSYNPSEGWYGENYFGRSSNGSSWNPVSVPSGPYAQFALNATPVPEPSSEILLGLGGLGLLWHRRIARAV